MSHKRLGLVVTRTVDQRVTLTRGSLEIGVTLVSINGDQIRLAFDAPWDVVIVRDEITPEAADHKIPTIRLACRDCDTVEADGIKINAEALAAWRNIQELEESSEWYTHLGICPRCAAEDLLHEARMLARKIVGSSPTLTQRLDEITEVIIGSPFGTAY